VVLQPTHLDGVQSSDPGPEPVWCPTVLRPKLDGVDLSLELDTFPIMISFETETCPAIRGELVVLGQRPPGRSRRLLCCYKIVDRILALKMFWNSEQKLSATF